MKRKFELSGIDPKIGIYLEQNTSFSFDSQLAFKFESQHGTKSYTVGSRT